ncbi:PilT/PilU family type 4a pilus ATPase [Luteolibacter yonseiensis]|uniref:PilT/PilU family type 4a pilus ATPase n=1 Tax=Luteolibacter yonseiensis TaxID=1144680 RepID=A0A934R0J0_9BACT|nr:PilT/PilU family type 4a pilus ATPase [Luteolibacter yonseiensis]MBK1814497.1 PilT/PilU family type 4a pilus ATPase [Luteolibacter yonseiensis]
MAIIDTFLNLMVERRAERLVLVSDRTPFLLMNGQSIELSMPPLREDTLRRISQEMMGEQGGNEGKFRAANLAEFGYRIQPGGPEWRIDVHTLGDVPKADQPVEDPLTQKVADFVQPSPKEAAMPEETNPSPGRPDPELISILHQALSQNASDLFLSSGKPPRIRQHGVIRPLDSPAPGLRQILAMIPDEEARRELERSGSVDFAVRWEMPDGPRRIRINVFRHLDGVAAALRPIRRRVPQISELSLPGDFQQLATFPNGLVLVTGVAGAGKSTTLAALVDHLNRTRPRHVITIEDPIEYEHQEIQCMIHQRQVGGNVESFAAGLRAALRESPDVILLGEMRDHETISAALTAAETGHLVLSTLHAGSASTAVNRIVDVFPGHQQTHIRSQLALSLRAVVSQRLIPSRTGGLVPAVEKLMVTPAVANGIREGQDHFMRNAMLTGGEEGMVTLERSLATLVRDRLIDRETAIRTAVDPKLLAHLLE